MNIYKKIDLIYVLNNIKYNFNKNILNIKYRIYFKKRAIQRAYDYIHNNELYGNRKWN